MNLSPARQQYWLERGALHYAIICMIALAVIYLDLSERGMDLMWGGFPVVVGLGGLATRWSAAPIFLLLALAVSLNVELNQSAQFSLGYALLIPDLILCAAALAFVMAHYRLTLIDQAFAGPPKPRKDRQEAAGATTVTNPAQSAETSLPTRRLISPREVGHIILAVPLWAIAAECVWLVLPARWGNPGFQPAGYWRLILLAWLVAGPLLFAAAVFGYLRLARQSPADALLQLQDVVWRETRWEQRRINRWFAWAHVQSRRRQGWRLPSLRWVALVLTAALVAIVFILRLAGGR